MHDTITFMATLDDPNPTSAFQKVGIFDKKPAIQGCLVKERNNGYGSDFSPEFVSLTSNNWTLSTKENYDDLVFSEALFDLNLNDDQVFIDSFAAMSKVIAECHEDNDIDEEVEQFLNNNEGKIVQLPDTSRPQRPSAPIPVHRNFKIHINSSHGISHGISSTCRKLRDRHVRRIAVPGVTKRSIWIQTQNPSCQLTKNSTSSSFENCFKVYSGEALSSTHIHPDCNDSYSILPDIVLTSRDRSMSLLPDVQTFPRREKEQRMGRELRRISDDFLSFYLSKSRHSAKRRNVTKLPPLFPFKIGVDLYSCYWDIDLFQRVLTATSFCTNGTKNT